MLEKLDTIPWSTLEHAYGSAADVPVLIRALQTASPDDPGEDSPLYSLFGNIWHQGTVYEATAYAVPFLIELAGLRTTPDRVGILQLLAAIADGASYRAVHGNLLCESDYESKKSEELVWVEKAHLAVAKGIDVYISLFEEKDEIHMAAAHVLAQFPENADRIQPLLIQRLSAESMPLYRAGLLLLLSRLENESQRSFPILMKAIDSEKEVERRAAIVSLARIKPSPLPWEAREAILKTLCIPDFETSFNGLPWDVEGEIDCDELIDCLDKEARNEAAEEIVRAIENGHSTNNMVVILLEILFPRRECVSSVCVRTSELSLRQRHAVRAIATTMMEGKRIFYGCYKQWGLPDTKQDWIKLKASIDKLDNQR
jgi:hypothetical protein